MKDEFTFRSTPNGKPPSGYQKRGTFRDVTLRGVDPKTVDEYDMECIERGITRRDLANELLGHPEDGGDEQRFYDIFSKTNYYTSVVEHIGKRLRLNQDDEKSTINPAPEP